MSREPGRGFSRRQLLFGGAAAAGAGAATVLGAQAVGGALAVGGAPDAAVAGEAERAARLALETAVGEATVPFHGARQAGIETPPQACTRFLALDLLPEVDAAALRRMLRVLSDDAARITQGRAPLADTEPELAHMPARLTVTFGFGPGLVERAGGTAPEWLRPLPAFGIDRLRPEWSGGDLLLHLCADDPVTVAHAARMLLKDARSFASVRWTQQGFRRAAGAEASGQTMRNLFGQLDGTVNPKPGTADFDELVWATGEPAWLGGGTSLVLRRIAMDLDGWDRVDRPGREAAVGRKLASGAPLTGEREHDEPDFEALTPVGFPLIADFSHLRRSRSEVQGERIFRRGYNYDESPADGSVSDAGLLFASYQADVDRQFVPIQRRLDELDLLNEWTTPIGSAVFAIPPGCAEGGYIGDMLV
ncbi:Dyp-type peroxidase [Agromyces sp. NPDC058136]|uniref:Dyp-type peroxidase n=1 Tax=Agromyces sp. NPDC058136 TaxID=3346354 RepID=UPI0036DA1C46